MLWQLIFPQVKIRSRVLFDNDQKLRSNKDTKKIESFVGKYVDGAKLMTDSHGEITFKMPSSSSEQFLKFFEHLESCF